MTKIIKIDLIKVNKGIDLYIFIEIVNPLKLLIANHSCYQCSRIVATVSKSPLSKGDLEGL